MKESETENNPNPSRLRGRGVEVSKTLFYYFGKHKKKHMFIERMLDKHVFGYDNRTKEMLEDIKTFDTSFVSK